MAAFNAEIDAELKDAVKKAVVDRKTSMKDAVTQALKAWLANAIPNSGDSTILKDSEDPSKASAGSHEPTKPIKLGDQGGGSNGKPDSPEASGHSTLRILLEIKATQAEILAAVHRGPATNAATRLTDQELRNYLSSIHETVREGVTASQELAVGVQKNLQKIGAKLAGDRRGDRSGVRGSKRKTG